MSRTVVRVVLGVIALALWATSVFEHDAAGLVFRDYFNYGAANWGPNGRQVAEQRLFLAMGVGAVSLAVAMLAKVLLSAAGRRALPDLLARWGVGLLSCLAANRFLICIQSENVHFAQFALFALLLSVALGPRRGFLITVVLGFLDELHQHRVIYWGEVGGRLDWTDMCLDACGAALGALPVTTFARVGRYTAGTEDELVVTTRAQWLKIAAMALVGAGLLAFLLLGTDLGHYPNQRPWEMLDNRKPFHTLSTREGVPAVLALTLLLYYVVDERRRAIPICAFLAALVAWHVGVTLPARNEGEPVHENVPSVTIPRAKAAVTVDGKLGPEEWAGAATVELHHYAPNRAAQFAGVRGANLAESAKATLGPEVGTKARLLWDDRALFVAFECETKDAWARDFQRDDPEIASSPCVELFLDTDAAERAYYEFEVTAANRVQDLYVYWPVPPQWIPQPTNGEEFVGLGGWDAKHLETAVQIDGELDLVPTGVEPPLRTKPASKGYTVEIAIPWADLKGRALGVERKPQPGARFRANLYRVDPKRPGTEPTSFMAWSPVHVPLTFHRPAFFGQLVLGE